MRGLLYFTTRIPSLPISGVRLAAFGEIFLAFAFIASAEVSEVKKRTTFKKD